MSKAATFEVVQNICVVGMVPPFQKFLSAKNIADPISVSEQRSPHRRHFSEQFRMGLVNLRETASGLQTE